MARWASLSLAVAALLGLTACAAPAGAPGGKVRPLFAVSGPQPGKFLTLSDVHYDGNSADIWGMNQETSAILWTRAQAQAKAVIASENPGFILYLGDLPAHNQSVSAREGQFKAVLDGLQELVAGTDKRLLFLPGNNDSDGDDYCAFTTDEPDPAKPGGTVAQTPFDSATNPGAWPVVNAQPGDIIDAAHLPRGFYSAYPLGAPKGGVKALRLLALNTVIFNPNYGGFSGNCVDVATRQADADTQLEWLADQLAAAASAGDKLIVAMHVPPGTDGYGGKPNWNPALDYTGSAPALAPYRGKPVQDVYLSLVAAHQDRIVGTLSSHTHLNDMRRLRDCGGVVTELDLSIPAITTDHGSNPAMKLFAYDAAFEWTEAATRYASEATGKDWAPANHFGFAQNYPCPSCTGSETLAERIAKIGDKDLLRNMLAFLTVKRSATTNPRSYGAAMDVRCSS